jgi:hypothetical protein
MRELHNRIFNNWLNGNRSDAALIIGSLSMNEIKALLLITYGENNYEYFLFFVDKLKKPTH